MILIHTLAIVIAIDGIIHAAKLFRWIHKAGKFQARCRNICDMFDNVLWLDDYRR